MPIINLASTEEQAHKYGNNVKRIDCNNDGKVIMWTYQTHHGLCVKDREANFYGDSDFYMTVYNPEKDSFEEIQFATTRGWSYPCYGSSPDASPEVMKKWKEHNEKIAKENIERRKISRAKEISFGKEVIVISGRKLQKGSIWEVVKTGNSGFGPWVLLRDEKGNQEVISQKNVEVHNFERYL